MKITIIKFLFLLSLPVLFPLSLKCQDYNISKIPESLKENALAVVRKYHYKVEVQNLNKLSYEQVYAITVFNKKGDDLIQFVDYFDSSDKYQTLEANCYDKSGKRVKKYRNKDFDEYSAVSGFELFSDARVKYLNPVSSNYPYTIEYIIRKEDRDFLSMPVFFPVRKENVAIESMKYHLEVPAGYGVNIREYNVPPAKRTSNDKGTSYTWSIINFEALEIEPFSPEAENFLPKVVIVPEEFEYSGYKGSLSTWNKFGQWVKNLNEGLDFLPEEQVEKIHALTDDVPDEVDKVRILYDHLQKNTRYVGVSYGIGGYKPIPAEDVCKYGYGDCKALSNYMKAMLKEAGIKSYYTLVYGSPIPSKIDTTLPSQQFNHAILCVPVKKDTLWLECTSQTNPFNYIAGFTDNRYVLLIKEDGGELVKTKAYFLEENLQATKAEVKYNEAKDIFSGQISASYEGRQYDNMGHLSHMPVEKQKEYLLENLDITQFRLNSFDISGKLQNDQPVANLNLDLNLPRYYTKSGDKILLPLNLMNKWKYIPKKLEDRKNEVYISTSWMDKDTIIYEIPSDYEIQYIPDEVKLKLPFGEYYSRSEIRDNKLCYTRCMKMREGIYPKEMYGELVSFFSDIVRADGAKAMLGPQKQ